MFVCCVCQGNIVLENLFNKMLFVRVLLLYSVSFFDLHRNIQQDYTCSINNI